MSRRPFPFRKWLRKKLRTIDKIKRGDITPASVARNKWQKLKRLASLNTIEEVPLSRLLIGQQSGIPLGQWVESTGDYSRVSRVLCESPYADFLRQAAGDQSILEDAGRLKKTAYYAMAQMCRQYTGNFMGKITEKEILDWMRSFYAFYISSRAGTPYRSDVFQDDGHSGPKEPVQAFKIRDSEYYEIIDGHHRCAIACMSGRETIPVEIAGETYSYLQSLILNSTGYAGQEMAQPVDAPEVRHWPARQQCLDIFRQKLCFLHENNLLASRETYLDLPCGYGYFLKLFKEQGLSVYGIDPDENGLQIAKSIYAITKDECRREAVQDYLNRTARQFTIVSFNTPLEPSDKSAPALLKDLGRIAGRVLFLQCDTLQADASAAPQKRIGNLIGAQTSFGKTFFLEHGIIACVR